MLLDNTNLHPPWLRPGFPSYPAILEVLRVTGKVSLIGSSSSSSPGGGGSGENLYTANLQQSIKPLGLRDRIPVYLLEPNGSELSTTGKLYVLGRLIDNYNGLPLYATFCCCDQGGAGTVQQATITGNTNNFLLDIGADILELTTTGNYTFTGLTLDTSGTGSSATTITPANGTQVLITNTGPGTLTLVNQSGSTTGNQIITFTGGNISLPTNSSATLTYYTALNSWLVTSATISGGGISLTFEQVSGGTPVTNVGTAQFDQSVGLTVVQVSPGVAEVSLDYGTTGSTGTAPPGVLTLPTQTASGTPTYTEPAGSLVWNSPTNTLYVSQGGGTWTTIAGASPGDGDTSIQINMMGTFYGTQNFVYQYSTGKMIWQGDGVNTFGSVVFGPVSNLVAEIVDGSAAWEIDIINTGSGTERGLYVINNTDNVFCYLVDITNTRAGYFQGYGNTAAFCEDNGYGVNANKINASSGYYAGGTAGISATVTLAMLTPISGTNGSLTIVDGIVTSYTAPT